MQIHELPDGVIGATECSPIDNGTTNRKVTLADIGAYVLNTLTMSLGNVTRTVKAAIDAIQTKVGTAALDTTAQDLSEAINEHEDDISTLNSNLTTEMFTGTRASGFDGGRLEGIYNKAANTVMLSFVILRNDTNITANEQLFTISEKYRPSGARNGTAMVLTSSGYTVGSSQVSSSGIVTQGATNVGRLVMGVIMYSI